MQPLCCDNILALFFGFWLISAAVYHNWPQIARCAFVGLGLYDGIDSLYVTREKQIWLFLAKNCFRFLAYFRQFFGAIA